MICFGILRNFGEKKLQKRKTENLGKTGSYATAWDALPRRRPTPQRGMPCRGETEVPKLAPFGYTTV